MDRGTNEGCVAQLFSVLIGGNTLEISKKDAAATAASALAQLPMVL